MTTNFLKTSTSLALVLSMVLPVPAIAQQATVPCGPDLKAPCLLEDGAVLTKKAAKQQKAAARKAAKNAKKSDFGADAESAARPSDKAAAAIEAAKAEADASDAKAVKKALADKAAKAEAAASAQADKDVQKKADKTAAKEAKAKKKADVVAEFLKKESDSDFVVTEPETVISEDTGLSEAAAEAEADVAAKTEGEAPVSAAAKTRSGAKAGDKNPKVTVSKVTEADVRSSDEDFVSRKKRNDAKKNDNKKANNEDDGGLTDLQKILLAAGGVAVVGALLNNGSRVVENTGDRVVAQRDDGSIYVLKDDDALVRRPGSTVETQTYSDGSTVTTVTKANGEKVLTIRDAQGRVLRRSRVLENGTEYVLFDDTAEFDRVDVSTLPRTRSDSLNYADQDAALEAALGRDLGSDIGRRFSLNQIRNIRAVRELVPQIDLEAVTFDTGSAAIRPDEAQKLARLGRAMQKVIEEHPDEVFLIEGHTDAVGSAVYNLTLSDRRAESLALALAEYFDIPAENMVVQGYGESYLKVASEGDVRANRRVAVRRITPLLGIQTASN